MKWGFVPQGDNKPHYLVVNADESEPGACKDVPIMLANPHAMLEGVIIGSYAIRANNAFVYIRGEVPHVIRRVRAAVNELYAAGLLGKNILGSGFDLDVVVHAGAGAYICGEETALLNSLEGLRGQPRLKPPFPAVAGLYAAPTVVNNVETLAQVPYIVERGADWFKAMGSEKSPGFKVFAVAGHVKRPGIYEAALGTTMRELLEHAGGMRDGSELKFWVPGGSSVPMLTPDHLDVPLTYEDMAAAGTMLGTGTAMLFDQTTSVVKTVTRWLEFYKHESCGKCTPCREGTYWMTDLLKGFEKGVGKAHQLPLLTEIAGQINGRSFCPLGDAAATPYPGAMKYFADEFEQATTTPVDEQYPPAATTVFVGADA
jgi:NADH-quinone oxidoreductase subunit F